MELAIGFVLIFLIGAIVSGVIGTLLGGSVNKGTAGFWLGFFLGPIGWIVVLLLPRETSHSRQTQTPTPTPTQTQKPKKRLTRDLSSDEYKVMLGKKYEISRNELFDQFECDGKLFESLDDALKYADELEAKAVEAEIEAEMQRAERAVQAEKYLSEMTFEDMQKKLGKKYIWVTMPILKNGYKIEEHASGKKQYFETLSQLREYYKKTIDK